MKSLQKRKPSQMSIGMRRLVEALYPGAQASLVHVSHYMRLAGRDEIGSRLHRPRGSSQSPLCC